MVYVLGEYLGLAETEPRIQLVKQINGKEMSWTLGKLVDDSCASLAGAFCAPGAPVPQTIENGRNGRNGLFVAHSHLTSQIKTRRDAAHAQEALARERALGAAMLSLAWL